MIKFIGEIHIIFIISFVELYNACMVKFKLDIKYYLEAIYGFERRKKSAGFFVSSRDKF